MTRRILAATTITLAALAAAGCGGGSGKLASSDVLVVCGQHVTTTDYTQLLGQEKAQLGGKLPKAGTSQYAQMKQQLVQILVQKAAYQHKADQLGIKVSDKQVDDQLKQIITQQFGGKHATFLTAIKKQGLTEKDARAIVHFNLVEQELHKKIVNDVKVSDAEARAYYAKNTATYKQAASRPVAHILVKTKALADKLEAQLKNGADFATLAKKYSTDTSSKPSGGKLTDTKGSFVPEFEKVAFVLATGKVSAPVHSQFGWHIIKALGPVKPASQQSFKTVSPLIKQTLLSKKQQSAVTKWVNDVKKECIDKAKYASGYAPPGATAAPTPVVTKTS
jgi:parvulin-like peptidyl-prolyl isomerase